MDSLKIVFRPHEVLKIKPTDRASSKRSRNSVSFVVIDRNRAEDEKNMVEDMKGCNFYFANLKNNYNNSFFIFSATFLGTIWYYL